MLILNVDPSNSIVNYYTNCSLNILYVEWDYHLVSTLTLFKWWVDFASNRLKMRLCKWRLPPPPNMLSFLSMSSIYISIFHMGGRGCMDHSDLYTHLRPQNKNLSPDGFSAQSSNKKIYAAKRKCLLLDLNFQSAW